MIIIIVKLKKCDEWLLWDIDNINIYDYNQSFTNESNFGIR